MTTTFPRAAAPQDWVIAAANISRAQAALIELASRAQQSQLTQEELEVICGYPGPLRAIAEEAWDAVPSHRGASASHVAGAIEEATLAAAMLEEAEVDTFSWRWSSYYCDDHLNDEVPDEATVSTAELRRCQWPARVGLREDHMAIVDASPSPEGMSTRALRREARLWRRLNARAARGPSSIVKGRLFDLRVELAERPLSARLASVVTSRLP